MEEEVRKTNSGDAMTRGVWEGNKETKEVEGRGRGNERKQGAKGKEIKERERKGNKEGDLYI